MKYKNFSFGLALSIMMVTMTSCEDLIVQQGSAIDLGTGTSDPISQTFSGNIDDYFAPNPHTKTMINDTPNSDSSYSLYWQAGDEISISEGSNTAIYVTEGTSSVATFTKRSGYVSNTASKYLAFYPASITPSNQKLPAEQEYVARNVKNYPMYAESNDYNLSFKNLCGILRINITNTDSENPINVKKISVNVDGQGLSGNFTIDSSFAAVVSGTDGVVLNCPTAVSLSSQANSFNVIVPKGAYNAMKIKITAEDGKELNLQGQSTVTIQRSRITQVNISLKEADFNNALEVLTFIESDVDFTER